MLIRNLCWLAFAAIVGCSGGEAAPDATPADAGRTDAKTRDGAPLDTGPDDRGAGDMGQRDNGPSDAPVPDFGELDLGSPDIDPVDADSPDGARPDADIDAGLVDMSLPDTGTPDTGVDAGQPDTGGDAGISPTLTAIEVPVGGIPEGVGSGTARGIPVILSGSNFLPGDQVGSSAAELEVRSVQVIDANYIVAEVAVPIAGPDSGTMNVDLSVRRFGTSSGPQSVTVVFYPEITNANAATAGDGVYSALSISAPLVRTQRANWTIWGFTSISGAITLAGGGTGGQALAAGDGLAGGAAGARGSGGGGAGASADGMAGGNAAAGGPAIGNAYVVPIDAHLGSGGGGGSGSNTGGDGGSSLAITTMHPTSITGSFDTSGTPGDDAVPDAMTGCATGADSAGGGGSGGSVVVRSPDVTGNFSVNVSGGLGGALACGDNNIAGGSGSPGRIRIDGEVASVTVFTPSTAVTARGPMWDVNAPITVQSGSVITARGDGIPVGSQWVAREQGNPGVESRPAAAASAAYTVVEDPVQPVLRLICIGVDTPRGAIVTGHASSDREHCLWFAVLP